MNTVIAMENWITTNPFLIQFPEKGTAVLSRPFTLFATLDLDINKAGYKPVSTLTIKTTPMVILKTGSPESRVCVSRCPKNLSSGAMDNAYKTQANKVAITKNIKDSVKNCPINC